MLQIEYLFLATVIINIGLLYAMLRYFEEMHTGFIVGSQMRLGEDLNNQNNYIKLEMQKMKDQSQSLNSCIRAATERTNNDNLILDSRVRRLEEKVIYTSEEKKTKNNEGSISVVVHDQKDKNAKRVTTPTK